jgi:hypothetical protein
MSNEALEEVVGAQLAELARKLESARERMAVAERETDSLLRQGQAFAEGLRATGSDVEGLIPEAFRAPANTFQSRVGAGQPAARRQGRAPKAKQVKHTDMVDWCRQVLVEAGGGPIHVGEIRDALERDPHNRGWRAPGAKTVSNVGVHLAQAEDVFEPGTSKGTWQLVNRGGN